MLYSTLKCRVLEEELRTFWPQWHVERQLSEGAYGDVYQIYKEEYGVKIDSALKVLQISDENIILPTVPVTNQGPASSPAAGRSSASDRPLSDGRPGANPGNIESMPQDFQNEINIMGILRGAPNIMRMEDFYYKSEGRTKLLFVRMELLTSFKELLRGSSDFSPEEIIRLGTDICRALAYCEKKNIIHRDIKPANLFIDPFGNCKVGDFGASKRIETVHLAHTMTGVGTISYMAPEIYNGRPYNNTVDIYALGLVLYQLLNKGRMPFMPFYPEEYTTADIDNSNYRRLHGETIPSLYFPEAGETPGRTGKALDGVIRKACSFHPSDRFQTAREFSKALEGCRKRAFSTPPASSLSVPEAPKKALRTEPEQQESLFPDDRTVLQRTSPEKEGPSSQRQHSDYDRMTFQIPGEETLRSSGQQTTLLPDPDRKTGNVFSDITETSLPESRLSAAPKAGASAAPKTGTSAASKAGTSAAPKTGTSAAPKAGTSAASKAGTSPAPKAGASEPEPSGIPAGDYFPRDNQSPPKQISDSGPLSNRDLLTDEYTVKFPTDEENTDEENIQVPAPPRLKKAVAALIALLILAVIWISAAVLRHSGRPPRPEPAGAEEADAAGEDSGPEPADPNALIIIPDPVLKKTILDALSLKDQKITAADAIKLTTLNCGGSGKTDDLKITDLTGISSFVNLESLFLGDNQITDLAPLAGLEKLTTLYISSNGLADLSPLEKLPQLQTLFVSGNKITDITPLKGLTALKWLEISHNRIDDAAPLESLTALETLQMSQNRITDVTPLNSLTRLQTLQLQGNRISDISPLSSLKDLTVLDISFNQITDLEPVSELTQLKTLSVEGNSGITDFSPLEKLPDTVEILK